jgi:DNA-binding Xre family transcriptional regulator
MINSLQEVLDKKPDEVKIWMKNVLEKNEQIPEHFNWHGLADCIASNARTSIDTSGEKSTSALAWAEVASLIYDFLSKKYPESSSSYLYSEMTLRVFMISTFGIDKNSVILNSDKIVAWFFDNLEVSHESALVKSTEWREAFSNKNTAEMKEIFENNFEDIKKLRSIKSRLNIINQLCQVLTFQPSEELRSWLSIWKILP